MKKEKTYNEAVDGDEGFVPGEGYPSCDGEPCANVSDDSQDGTDTMADAAEGGDKAGAGSDLTAALAEWQDKFIRLQAEFDNYRKRTLKEKMDLVQTGGRDVLLAMLPVRDDVQRAVDAMQKSDDIEALRAGVTLISQKFTDTLRQKGVTEIDVKGREFDADLCEAVAKFAAGEEMQGKVVDIIRYAADALASVPSIVMGLFGYALFVEAMGLGLSMVSAALALALLMLPIVMRTTEEAIRAVPRYIRWGAYGLGATKWQVVSKIVLPSAFGRIATGIVLAIGRAIGETAVVLYTMGQAINLPISPLDSGRPMTVHLYLLANDGINMNAAYGTALLLMAIILAFNLFARYLSRKRR